MPDQLAASTSIAPGYPLVCSSLEPAPCNAPSALLQFYFPSRRAYPAQLALWPLSSSSFHMKLLPDVRQLLFAVYRHAFPLAAIHAHYPLLNEAIPRPFTS